MIRTFEGKLRHTGCERLNMSWWQKGKPKGPQSPELIMKRANAIRGSKRSKESKKIQSEIALASFRNGRITHNKGKTKSNYAPLNSVSTKMIGNKNSACYRGALNPMFGKSAPHLVAISKSRIGIPLPLEQRKKMSIKSKASWVKTREKRIELLKKVWCKHLGMTYLEKKFYWLCEEYGLPFRYVGNGQLWITSCGIHINPDFVDIFGRHIVVEVYARCWKQSDYEIVRKTLLNSAGFKVIFLSDKIMNPKDWKQRCLEMLNGTDQDLSFI